MEKQGLKKMVRCLRQLFASPLVHIRTASFLTAMLGESHHTLPFSNVFSLSSPNCPLSTLTQSMMSGM